VQTRFTFYAGSRCLCHHCPQDLARSQVDDDRFVQVPLRAMAKHLQVRDEEGWCASCVRSVTTAS
jgi:hypothetical protein